MAKKPTKNVQYEPIDDPILPEIRKTSQMLEIEQEYGGRDVRLVIRDLYNKTGSQRKVAETLGLEQSTITTWAWRLGIEFTVIPVARINV